MLVVMSDLGPVQGTRRGARRPAGGHAGAVLERRQAVPQDRLSQERKEGGADPQDAQAAGAADPAGDHGRLHRHHREAAAREAEEVPHSVVCECLEPFFELQRRLGRLELRGRGHPRGEVGRRSDGAVRGTRLRKSGDSLLPLIRMLQPFCQCESHKYFLHS
jgi:hypothetical protein